MTAERRLAELQRLAERTHAPMTSTLWVRFKMSILISMQLAHPL